MKNYSPACICRGTNFGTTRQLHNPSLSRTIFPERILCWQLPRYNSYGNNSQPDKSPHFNCPHSRTLSSFLVGVVVWGLLSWLEIVQSGSPGESSGGSIWGKPSEWDLSMWGCLFTQILGALNKSSDYTLKTPVNRYDKNWIWHDPKSKFSRIGNQLLKTVLLGTS